MSGELPEGWIHVPLGDLARPTRPRRNPQEYPHLPFVGMEQVESNTRRLLGTQSAREMRSAAFHFQLGDVLYGRLRPYLNKVLCAQIEGLCSSEFIVLPPNGSFEPEFLAFYLSTEGFVAYANQLNKGDRPRVSFEQIAEHEIPLPPLAEQRRIVAKLETLLAKVDACQKRLAKIPVLVKRFRQSVLAAACSGRLTADWRDATDLESAAQQFAKIQKERLSRFDAEADSAKTERRRPLWSKPELLAEPIEEDLAEQPEIPDTWVYCRLGNLAEVVRGASPRPAGDPRYFGGNIPWITVAELTKDEAVFLDEVNQFVTEEGKERSRFIKPGTLLLTNSGATLGVPKITRLGGCINDGSVALVDIPLTSQLYLFYFLKGQTWRLRSINQGAAQPNLNTEIVKNIVTPLPPLCEQQEIVRRVEALFALADQIGARCSRAQASVDQVAPSVLAKAFRGELVPTEAELAEAEGRDYEPASVLVERIRAASASVGPAPERIRSRGIRRAGGRRRSSDEADAPRRGRARKEGDGQSNV